MIRRYVYAMAVGVMVSWAPLIYGDEQPAAIAYGGTAAAAASPAEPARPSGSSGWYKMFGYPNIDEARELAHITAQPMMIVFR